MERRALRIFWLCYWRVLCRHIFSISPISTSGWSRYLALAVMTNQHAFKDKKGSLNFVAADAEGAKKGFITGFSKDRNYRFSSYLLSGTWSSITFLIHNFSCLLCRVYSESHDVGTAPVWLSQNSNFGWYSKRCAWRLFAFFGNESGRAMHYLSGCDYGVAYRFPARCSLTHGLFHW